MRRFWYWINNIEGIGNSKIRRLLAVYGEPERVYRAKEGELMAIVGIQDYKENEAVEI